MDSGLPADAACCAGWQPQPRGHHPHGCDVSGGAGHGNLCRHRLLPVRLCRLHLPSLHSHTACQAPLQCLRRRYVLQGPPPGPVVRRPPLERRVWDGTQLFLRVVLPRLSHSKDFRIGTLAVPRPGARRDKVSAWTGWPGANIP